ncbi:MAG: ABC-type Fe3+-hydroxamate transport system, periplasmic component [Anaerocolumna sp.]|jgi:iron complex transport system substrate-binding protein|nr:ABC-type Fe3+-hydroxamate transport system, periplasmic component [Anaerocolumna sp.]
MKRLLIKIVMMLMFISLTACSGISKKTGDSVNNKEIEAVAKVYPNQGMDLAGNSIILPEKVDKIISLAPSVTQILFELGIENKLIAVDTQSPLYSEIAEDIPKYDMMMPDIENIMDKQPDIIFVSSMSNLDGEDLYSPIRNAGICVVEIPTASSIHEIKEDIRFIANCVDRQRDGEKLRREFEADIEKISAIGRGIGNKKSVYFEIASAPHIYSFGSDVFLNEMIEMIGAKNILHEQNGWMAPSEEFIIEANPDVILTNVNYIEAPVDEIKRRKGWEEVTAIENNQIFYIDNSSSNIPNHNIIKALQEMAKAVYPDEFAQIN